MQTTPETEALLAELYDRSQIVVELDGPQIEAWVSGLFDVFDESVPPSAFVDYCAAKRTPLGHTLCLAIATLSERDLAQRATAAVQGESVELPAWVAQIGQSQPDAAWFVEAPFGRSVVIGFVNPVAVIVVDEETEDTAHSILVELDDDGSVEDLQLAGPPRELLAEAVAADDRVTLRELPLEEATELITAAWPEHEVTDARYGPGVGANQQFVRSRLAAMTGRWLPLIVAGRQRIDIQRGLDDQEFADANRAALSTLQAAIDISPPSNEGGLVALDELGSTWLGVIRGDGGDLSPRERDALLWLEWADWLGAAIGLLRSGVGTPVTEEALVDHVNRCPEVSSTIDKADRDYAEWAFSAAIDLLSDVGIVKHGELTQAGFEALPGALVAAWGPGDQSS